MRYLINDPKVREKLKVGMKVKTNTSGLSALVSNPIIGIVGEITEQCFFIWQNTHRGNRGNIDPKTKGFKYSWYVSWEQVGEAAEAWIEIQEDREALTSLKSLKELIRYL